MSHTTPAETRDIYLPWGRYLVALQRLYQRIVGGEALEAEDDNTVGSKHTSCTWGLCDSSPALWPDVEDLLFPERAGEDRQPVKYLQDGQHCPMDQTYGGDQITKSPHGCYWRCRIFRPKHGERTTRKQALRLCIDRINLVERYLNAGKLACENPERQANQSQLIALLAQQSVDVPKTELLRVITMEQGPQRS